MDESDFVGGKLAIKDVKRFINSAQFKKQKTVPDADISGYTLDPSLSTDSIANKPLKNKVYAYLTQFLNLGRHFNISLYVVNHTPTGTRAESKSILNECHTITFFPANWNRQLVYLLQSYAGLDTKALQKVKNMESRWITIYRHYPQVLINETEVMMLKLLNSD